MVRAVASFARGPGFNPCLLQMFVFLFGYKVKEKNTHNQPIKSKISLSCASLEIIRIVLGEEINGKTEKRPEWVQLKNISDAAAAFLRRLASG